MLGLELTDPGFDHSVLCEFRRRLLRHEATERLLARVLDATREGGLLKARGRQRTNSTHVLTAVRNLNQVELLAETLRAALNAIAVVASDWLRALAPAAWHERYDRRIEDARRLETGRKRDAYVAQIGADGYRLLDALDGADALPDATALPVVAVLRRVWARHFERVQDDPGTGEPGGDGARRRPAQGRGPGDRVASPYDTNARFRTKAGTSWTGYMVHLTETCDKGAGQHRCRRSHARAIGSSTYRSAAGIPLKLTLSIVLVAVATVFYATVGWHYAPAMAEVGAHNAPMPIPAK